MNEQVSSSDNARDNECPICHMQILLSTSVPNCKHNFCFLCIKGAAMLTGANCPICRGPIDMNMFYMPRRNGIDLKMEAPKSPSVNLPKKRQIVESNEGGLKKVKEEPVDEDAEDAKPNLEALNAAMKRYYWLYKGRHQGWWRFEPRVEHDLEQAKESGLVQTDVSICGTLYTVDLDKMLQYRKGGAVGEGRQLKRVLDGQFGKLHVKGIAGILSNETA